MKNKLRIFGLIIYFFNFSVSAFSQSWQWSSQIGSSLGMDPKDWAGHVKVDNNGNSYWSGIFKGGYCYFPGDTTNVCSGYNDFLLFKYDANGNLVWWKQFGGNNSSNDPEGIGSIDIDPSGLYISGSFYGTCTFGTTTLVSSGSADVFFAKYDFNGNCIWAKKAGGPAYDYCRGITHDNLGNLYICGTNEDTAVFDNIIIPTGGFIAKYDTSGNLLWAKNKMGFAISFAGNGCTATPTGIKYFNGRLFINGALSNDTARIDTTNIYLSLDANSFYLTSFDTTGSMKWLRLFGGPSPYILTLQHGIDMQGNNYITGTCGGQGNFQTDTLTGNHVAFIVKYDSLGTESWVKGINASGQSFGNSVSTDSDGNSYITGRFSGNASFGSFNINATSTIDMFIARYNSLGDCLGVRAFGQAEGMGLAQDANGSGYVCGSFSNTINIGSNTYTSYGGEDIFIAKLDELVGIGENRSANNELIIYANPNAGKCTITVPEEFINEPYLQLTIFDNSGKIIQQKTVEMNDGKIKLNLETEAKGMYQVTLGNGKKIYSGKIIFE